MAPLQIPPEVCKDHLRAGILVRKLRLRQGDFPKSNQACGFPSFAAFLLGSHQRSRGPLSSQSKCLVRAKPLWLG